MKLLGKTIYSHIVSPQTIGVRLKISEELELYSLNNSYHSLRIVTE